MESAFLFQTAIHKSLWASFHSVWILVYVLRPIFFPFPFLPLLFPGRHASTSLFLGAGRDRRCKTRGDWPGESPRRPLRQSAPASLPHDFINLHSRPCLLLSRSVPLRRSRSPNMRNKSECDVRVRGGIRGRVLPDLRRAPASLIVSCRGLKSPFFDRSDGRAIGLLL